MATTVAIATPPITRRGTTTAAAMVPALVPPLRLLEFGLGVPVRLGFGVTLESEDGRVTLEPGLEVVSGVGVEIGITLESEVESGRGLTLEPGFGLGLAVVRLGFGMTLESVVGLDVGLGIGSGCSIQKREQNDTSKR